MRTHYVNDHFMRHIGDTNEFLCLSHFEVTTRTWLHHVRIKDAGNIQILLGFQG